MSENISVQWIRGLPTSNLFELEELACKTGEAIFKRSRVRSDKAWTEYRRQIEMAKGVPVYAYSGLALVWLEAEFEAQSVLQDQLWGSDEPPLISLRPATGLGGEPS